MNGDTMNKGGERKVWTAPVLEGLQGVADVQTQNKGFSGDVNFPQSS